MNLKMHRRKLSPFTLTTVLEMRYNPCVATRIELVDINGVILGWVFMYSDDDSMEDVQLEDIKQSG